MDTFIAGGLVTLSASFTDADGIGADPTSVRLLYRDSTGAVTVLLTSQLTTGSSDGAYSYNLAIGSTQRTGIWAYRFESTGTVVAAAQDQFKILAAEVST